MPTQTKRKCTGIVSNKVGQWMNRMYLKKH